MRLSLGSGEVSPEGSLEPGTRDLQRKLLPERRSRAPDGAVPTCSPEGAPAVPPKGGRFSGLSPFRYAQSPPSPRPPSPFVQAEGDPRQEAAVTLIQSVFRAHLARVRHR